ncbi:MAG: thioesterase [Bacteroidetes bacterium]|nr:thioesterase [Bacteroidota bacterium]
MNPQPVWSDKYRINWYEADANNCASLVTICNFLQVSAFRHARNLGFDYTRKDGFDRLWVLVRILVHMDDYPSWNDEIEVKTWHRGAEGFVAMRDFEILDAQGKRLGAVSSHWFLLDPETRKPVVPEIDDEVTSSAWPVKVMDDEPGRIYISGDLPFIRSVTAGYTDLDMYLHVNNTRYIDWVLNLFPEEMHKAYAISSFTIEFLSEVKYGEEIRLFARIDAVESLVKGIRDGDGRTIFKARVGWRKRS